MQHHHKNDYSLLDSQDVITRLFHPRAEAGYYGHEKTGSALLIPVAKDVVVGASLFEAATTAATVLFFHGNQYESI